MKKTYFVLLSLIVCVLFCSAQDVSQSLLLKTYKLDNGFTVYLNEDHSSSSVMGMVVVKGGSKRDPKDATGTAHYFEHIMFKGTDKLGTIDYPSEKVYLDSISAEYDLLGKTTDEKQRKNIQQKINSLSMKAVDYAIPNELDRVLNDMGCTDVNAFTSEECIAYHNSFQASQMEKWLEIYSDRFIHPVFRLFQSELETIYEEKNMSADDMFGTFFESLLKDLLPGTPYGDHTVLGSAEHLKNPSLSKMNEYFETYYVPNNMALILTGDFDNKATIPLVEKAFGQLVAKELPTQETIALAPFKGRQLVQRRLLPVKVGVLGYQSVPQGHPDQLALDVCSSVLSNYSYTGLLDELTNDNKLMEVLLEEVSFEELGCQLVIMVPKLLGQSLKNAEKLVLKQINKLKMGDFDDALLDAVKLSMIKINEEDIEEPEWRINSIMDLFLYNKKWDDVIHYSEAINALTKEDIVKVANRYFGDNYLAFFSKTGFPKKDKVKKPDYEPLVPKNTEAQSQYAKDIAAMEVVKCKPRFVEQGIDFSKGQLNENTSYYYVQNPINKIFTLDIKFHIGTIESPEMALADDVLSYCGTSKYAYSDFSKAMQQLGAEYEVYSDNNYFDVYVSGLEKNLEPTLRLMNELLTDPKLSEKEQKKIVRNQKMDDKFDQKDLVTETQALFDFALFNERSNFRQAKTPKELRKMSVDEMVFLVKKATDRNADLHYVGAIGEGRFAKLAKENLPILDAKENNDKWYNKAIDQQNENLVYFLNDKKAIQTQIVFVVQGDKNESSDDFNKMIFNEYFSGNMSSIVFQEIREFKSLAYSAGGYYKFPYNRNLPGVFVGYMSTQADKTIEALQTYMELIENMPEKPERMESVKNSLKQSINSQRPSFRNISQEVPEWKYQGFEQDPNKTWYPQFDSIEFSQVKDFHEKYMKDKKMVIVLAGNKKQIDMQQLKQFGKVIELKKSDIFN